VGVERGTFKEGFEVREIGLQRIREKGNVGDGGRDSGGGKDMRGSEREGRRARERASRCICLFRGDSASVGCGSGSVEGGR